MLSNNPKEFNEALKEVRLRLGLSKVLPNKVLDPKYKFFTVCDFAYITYNEFFNGLKDYLLKRSESYFEVLALEPDPVSYFYKHFKKFPLIKFQLSISSKDYTSSMNEDPGENTADALGLNGRILVYFSVKNHWVMYADAEFEICIAAFSSESEYKSFLESSNSIPWAPMNDAIKNEYVLSKLSNQEKEILVQNYD